MGEPCLICREDARRTLNAEVRAFVEQLVLEYPPGCVPWLVCWNCRGAGEIATAQVVTP